MQRIGSSTLSSLAIALLAASPATAAPTVFTVDTAAQRDSAGDLPSNCTLGDALVAANGDAAEDGCGHPSVGSGGPFEIVLPAGSGPYVLELAEPGSNGNVGLPVVRSAVTVHGNGNSVERNGAFACPDPVADEFRIVEVAAGARLVIESLALVNGCAPMSGGVHNKGQLVMHGATLSYNVALSGHGGGLGNDGGNAELVDTLVSDNSASGDGGGVYNGGNALLVLKRSTVAHNAANSGGGVENMLSDAMFLNSTLSSNAATKGGGLSNSGGASFTLISSTVAGNQAGSGPGLYNRNGTMTFTGSLLADRCLFERSPGNTDGGHNLERWNVCGLNAASSMPNQPTGIGSLGDNGGATPTHALRAGSLAIDAGDSGTCTLAGVDGMDQRGLARPDGDPASAGSCDIGAVEHVDCDANSLDDGGEIVADPSLDGNANGALDACEDQPPVAVAGPDQTLECSSATGASATLDGSASSDPEGGALSFLWTGPFGSVSGPRVDVVVPPGGASVALEVTDVSGQSAGDSLHVAVNDTSPPTASASLERVGMNGDWDDVRVQAACSDVCDPGVVMEAFFDGMTVADGATVQVKGFEDASQAPMLTVRCLDAAGNTAEASAAAPVREPVVEEPPRESRWSRWAKHREMFRERMHWFRERVRHTIRMAWHSWSSRYM
jgi:hypothetical protein